MTTKEVTRCPQSAGALACSNMPAAPQTAVGGTGSQDLKWEYIHHVPGRLRLRAAALRKNRNRAEEIEEFVKSIEGVSTAAVNLTTGSTVVIYDPSRLAPEGILSVLRRHGFTATPPRNSGATAAHAEAIPGKVGRAVLYLVLEHMLERSVKVAFAALL